MKTHDSEGSHKHKIQFVTVHRDHKARQAPSAVLVQQEQMEFRVMMV